MTYIELFKPLVGTWKTVLTVDGKTTEGVGPVQAVSDE